MGGRASRVSALTSRSYAAVSRLTSSVADTNVDSICWTTTTLKAAVVNDRPSSTANARFQWALILPCRDVLVVVGAPGDDSSDHVDSDATGDQLDGSWNAGKVTVPT